MKKNNVGSSLDAWLQEEGFYHQTRKGAIKRVLARVKAQPPDHERLPPGTKLSPSKKSGV